jgi:hypothetical protein
MRLAKGDRVRLTKAGRRMFPRMPITGTVVSVSEHQSVKVRPDGRKTPQGWHASFWKKLRIPTGE